MTHFTRRRRVRGSTYDRVAVLALVTAVIVVACGGETQDVNDGGASPGESESAFTLCGDWERVHPDGEATLGSVDIGMIVRVSEVIVGDMEGVVESAPDASIHQVPDRVWAIGGTAIAPTAFWSLDSDADMVRAELSVTGDDTMELTLDGSSVAQSWLRVAQHDWCTEELWEPSDETPASFTERTGITLDGVIGDGWCGLWERQKQLRWSSSHDGMLVQVDGDEDMGIVVSVEPHAGVGEGDVLWRSIGAMEQDWDLEVLGSDSEYDQARRQNHGGGVMSINIHLKPARGGTWKRIDDAGCGFDEGSGSGGDATDDDATPAGDPGDAAAADACQLLDLWILDSNAMAELMTAEAQQQEPDARVSYVGGVYDMDLRNEGTYTSTRSEWKLLFDSSGGAATMTWNGLFGGLVEFSDGSMEWEETTQEMDWKMEVDVGGVLQEVPGMSGPTVNADFLSGVGTYECVGDLLTVHVNDVTLYWNRA